MPHSGCSVLHGVNPSSKNKIDSETPIFKVIFGTLSENSSAVAHHQCHIGTLVASIPPKIAVGTHPQV